MRHEGPRSGLEVRRSCGWIAGTSGARSGAGRLGGDGPRCVAGAGRCAGPCSATAAFAMEELAALGGERGVGPAGKPVPYGLLSCGERGPGRRSARTGPSPTAVVSTIQALTSDFVGMDGRVRRRLRLAGDAMG